MPKKPDPIDAFFMHLFKSVTFYSALAVIVASLLIWKSLPTWEEKNFQKIYEQINEINNEVEHSPVQAWYTWQQLQQELKGKKIKSKILKTSISDLQLKMDAVYPEIQEEIERIEAENRKEAEDRLEAENERKRIQAEKNTREQLRKKYRNISQEAKDAVNSLKKLEAYTEVGVNKINYQDALAIAWGNVKVFVESADARSNYPELSLLLTEAIQSYKDAADAWDADDKSLLQTHWNLGSIKIKKIDYLVNQ